MELLWVILTQCTCCTNLYKTNSLSNKMKSKDAEKFTEYYRKNRVTGTYDKQREGTAYRRSKKNI